MSSLTEEQRKKIEENRCKALKRRAEVLKNRASNGNNLPTSLSNTSNFLPRPTTNTNILSSSNFGQKQIKPKWSQPSSTMASKPTNFYSNQSGTSEKQSDSKSIFTGKKITGNFLLSSKDTFVVNAPYHAQLIEICKTMPSKNYDIHTRKWSFNISDHNSLSTALSQLRPAVCISPLPSYVLQALKKTSQYPPPEGIDLMSLEPLLLEAFMPFQREGVCFGVSRGGRVLIADDMGLGKTVQALGIASYYRSEWPILIVTPSSVRYSWAEAVDRWVGSVDSYEVLVVNTCKESLEGTVIIISYDLLSRRAQEIKDMKFQIVIMDESHMLKNFKSIRYKSAYPVMKAAKRLILLSGTPALSRPSELFTQLSSINSFLIPNFQDYGIRYCGGKQQSWGWDFTGYSNMEELQVILESTIMIRRLKSEVITQLPAKQRMTIILDPSSIKSSTKAMKEMARNLNTSLLKGAEKHGALLQYFNESAVAKMKAVSDYIKELLTEGNKKFLVFAHHQTMMNKISETCEELKFHYIRIDGSTSGEARQKYVDHFQSDPSTRVAVLSITAASTGITLTAAHLVVFAELYWNPGFLIQAEDRVHRIGQQDSVLVQYLVAKGTADDIIWPLIQSKLEILNKAGLSKDNFSSASTSNQKKKDEGILKYFSELKDEDVLEACLPPESTSKRKRTSDDEEES